MMSAEHWRAGLALLLGIGATDRGRGAARSWPPPRRPRETLSRRLKREFEDQHHLAGLDDRLLDDVGLTREAVEQGLPFRGPSGAVDLASRKRRPRP